VRGLISSPKAQRQPMCPHAPEPLRGARTTVLQKDPSGESRERHVALCPVVLQALSSLPHREGILFRPARHNSHTLAAEGCRSTGREGGGQIRTAWAAACAWAGLPGEWHEWRRPDRPSVRKRFAPQARLHGLRHTWASWQCALHPDLLRLKEEGGWETLSMVERYAKRVPSVYKGEVEAWFAGDVDLRFRAEHVQPLTCAG
jgi:integrase